MHMGPLLHANEIHSLVESTVRVRRALISLNGTKQPHLGPPALGSGTLFKLNQVLLLAVSSVL